MKNKGKMKKTLKKNEEKQRNMKKNQKFGSRRKSLDDLQGLPLLLYSFFDEFPDDLP